MRVNIDDMPIYVYDHTMLVPRKLKRGVHYYVHHIPDKVLFLSELIEYHKKGTFPSSFTTSVLPKEIRHKLLAKGINLIYAQGASIVIEGRNAVDYEGKPHNRFELWK